MSSRQVSRSSDHHLPGAGNGNHIAASVSNSNCDSVVPVKMQPDFRNRYMSKIFKAMNCSRLVTAVWWDLG